MIGPKRTIAMARSHIDQSKFDLLSYTLYAMVVVQFDVKKVLWTNIKLNFSLSKCTLNFRGRPDSSADSNLTICL